ncbi:peroxisomal biogenesis factor 11 [Lipomyces arxii]|uniref:peroxisomal biogenesis factor 11 n=1 Tax=Lipomyces arxii TaxID=56418 RepID=UPI0034CF582B
MVANALVYHPTTAHLLRYLDSTVGRDKLMRFVQYFARFYVAYLNRTAGSSKNSADVWRSVMSLLSTARKIIRVGKPVQHFKAAATAYDNKTTDPVIRYTAIGRQLSYAVYLTIDTLILGHSTKLITLKNPQLAQKLYFRFWLAGIVFSISSSAYKHVGLSKLQTSLSNQSEKDVVAIKNVKAQQASNTTQLVLDLLDSSIPVSGLSLVPIDDGLVGIAGMVSSVIGASAQWDATA